jgi:N-methylhydantoinase A/oxoprolinase/acetone carboxylase beta subunit
MGIDVGGTNTDAVLMAGSTVLAKLKTPTTADITNGITTAMRHILDESHTAPGDVSGVMIGTTHFTNAIVERRSLAPTAIVRVALPAGLDIPPMTDWPGDIADALGRHVYMVHGGNEFDGREIAPLDPAEIADVAASLAERGITAIAVSAPFSPVTSEMEQRTASLLAEQVPGAQVTCSHQIGQLGLLERENAAILNAALRPLAAHTVAAFRAAVREMGITAPLYLTQNDGTLMQAGFAERFPVLTIASGPSNSVRGAAFLSGVRDAMVLDVGGTTCDIGVLVDGFPRKASVAVQVGGVRTNFRMPDVHSFGLGGGSIIGRDNGALTIGPRSVGYRITSEALVFGGETLTATDIAVAAGFANLGDASRVTTLDQDLVAEALAGMQATIDAGVDRMKTSAAAIPLIVVGGGSILVREVAGVSEVIRPDHFEAANAVGAAIAQISGDVDRVFALGDGLDRDGALAIAKSEAIERAVAAGAAPASSRTFRSPTCRATPRGSASRPLATCGPDESQVQVGHRMDGTQNHDRMVASIIDELRQNGAVAWPGHGRSSSLAR